MTILLMKAQPSNYNDLSSVPDPDHYSHSSHPSNALSESNTQLSVNNKKRTSVL